MRSTLRTLTLISLLAVPVLLSAQKLSRVAFVSVTDSQGLPVVNLTAADFEVREGDAKRPITFAGLSDFPMRIVLMVDTSSEIEQFQSNLKTALPAFLDAIPEKHEVGLVSTGRQFRVRQAPTTDRAKLKKEMGLLGTDGGGTVLLDGLREVETRFMKKDGVHWPVYVIITTDSPESSGNMQTDELKKIQTDMVARGTSFHGLALEKMGPTLTTDIVITLAKNFGGISETMMSGNALPDKMKAIAAQIVSDYDKMAKRYQIEYTSDAKYTGTVEAGTLKEGMKSSMSLRR